MRELKRVTEELAQANQIQIADIPKIDLYIDQVIQLFESNFEGARRNDKEKILTKTMINNYAKGKLFYPIQNKKYSRNHIMLISLIYQMKSALSINDVKQVLDGVNERAEKQDLDLERFYESYLNLQQRNLELFREGVDKQAQDVVEQVEITGEEKELQQVLLIASLVHTSNLYRRAAEKLVDEMCKGGEKNGESTD
jgi:DNA-binding transcriptional MerR regulator